MGKDLSYYKDIFSIIRSSTTIIALVIAGIWTYTLFIKGRKKYPRASITSESWSKTIQNKARLISLNMSIHNSGEVLINIEYTQTIIYKIHPIDDNLMRKISINNKDLDKTYFDWEILNEKETSWEKDNLEIEPGEKETIQYDFLLPLEVDVILVYYYVRNKKKREKGLGWSFSKIIEFSDNEKELNKNG